MNIAFITATAKEMKSATAVLSNHVAPPDRGFVSMRLPSGRLDLVVTGIGPINAGIETGAYLAQHHDIDVVCLLGIAGSFDLNQAGLGDIVCVTKEIYPEFGLVTPNGVTTDHFGFSQYENESVRIDQSISLHPEQIAAKRAFSLPVSWRTGTSLTVAGVSATPERAGHLQSLHHPLLENMEGFAVALACCVQHVDCIEVRTVSNRVGSRDKADWRIKDALASLSGVGNTLFNAFFSE